MMRYRREYVEAVCRQPCFLAPHCPSMSGTQVLLKSAPRGKRDRTSITRGHNIYVANAAEIVDRELVYLVTRASVDI